MELDQQPLEAWMRAVESRDARFDGWVVVGVTSTGIYCRPSCPTPVRPKRTNMRFFQTPAAAQQAGFRSCKRCAPDATPGSPEWNRRDDLVARAVRAIDDGVVDRVGVAGLARQLAVSPRHLQRILTDELGSGPMALARARRARSARALIEGTDLPFNRVALASGFGSTRQFNDTIVEVFARTPTEMRDRRSIPHRNDGWVEVRLAYRPPLATGELLRWLRLHAVAGVEEVEGSLYRRSLRFGEAAGVVEVDLTPTRGHLLSARFRLPSLSDLPFAVNRIRRQLDLDADPRAIAVDLSMDPQLQPLVAARPGLRAPGEVSGTDAAVRAVLHQQVSLASATAIASRLVRTHGIALAEPVGSVTHAFPTAGTWSRVDTETLGLPRRRARALVAVAVAIAGGWLELSPWTLRSEALQRMRRLEGIGPWTANVVAARALADPDAFCANDLALLRYAGRLGLPSGAAALDEHAQRWRPWRSYAMHHLWNAYLDRQELP